MSEQLSPAMQPRSSHTFWRRLGGGSLSISIILHSILLLIGVIWIFQIIPEKKADVDFMAKGGGGGQPGAKAETNMKKRATMTTMNAPRLVAKGMASTFTLPEPDPASAMSSVGALGSTGMSAGLGGSGSGGGKGNGKGKGFGDGMGPGLGGGAAGMSPFGMLDPKSEGLVGTYYDFKFDQSHKQIKDRWEIPDLCKVYRNFFNANWDERLLSKYYQAPQKLFATRIAVPILPAEKAPTYFGAEETKFPAWCVLYKGMVSPPESGTFRFVCASDDAMAVRMDRKQVLSHHYCLGKGYVNKPIEGLYNKSWLPEDYIPHPAHYPSSSGYLACGQWFTVTKGQWTQCEIMIMETGYGGVNSAILLLQKKGEEGQPLKLFHLDRDAAPIPAKVGNPSNIPPYDLASPQWQVKRLTGFDI